jgi:hypothetical protein
VELVAMSALDRRRFVVEWLSMIDGGVWVIVDRQDGSVVERVPPRSCTPRAVETARQEAASYAQRRNLRNRDDAERMSDGHPASL